MLASSAQNLTWPCSWPDSWDGESYSIAEWLRREHFSRFQTQKVRATHCWRRASVAKRSGALLSATVSTVRSSSRFLAVILAAAEAQESGGGAIVRVSQLYSRPPLLPVSERRRAHTFHTSRRSRPRNVALFAESRASLILSTRATRAPPPPPQKASSRRENSCGSANWPPLVGTS